MHQAYLIGITNYPNHPLAGVPNDLTLMRSALIHQGFDPASIHTFGDEDGTLTGLRDVLRMINTDFDDADTNPMGSSCFFYFSGSGMLSVDPLLGGIKPIDGDDLNFSTALPFAELNDYLPVRPGIQATVVLDC